MKTSSTKHERPEGRISETRIVASTNVAEGTARARKGSSARRMQRAERAEQPARAALSPEHVNTIAESIRDHSWDAEDVVTVTVAALSRLIAQQGTDRGVDVDDLKSIRDDLGRVLAELEAIQLAEDQLSNAVDAARGGR